MTAPPPPVSATIPGNTKQSTQPGGTAPPDPTSNPEVLKQPLKGGATKPVTLIYDPRKADTGDQSALWTYAANLATDVVQPNGSTGKGH